MCTRYNDPDPLSTNRDPLPVMNLDDTIVAIATPPGRGGIGVVRLAGPEARAIAAPMLRLNRDLEPNRSLRCDLIDPCGAGAPARVTADIATAHVGTAAPAVQRSEAQQPPTPPLPPLASTKS